MQLFTAEEILLLHFKIIEDFGGSHGVRDEGRLKSVVSAPSQSAFGQEVYDTAYKKAAVYLRNIIADHPFIDGNKRTAITLAGIFLQRHAVMLSASPKDLEDFAVQVAVEHLDIPAIAQWLQTNSTKSP